MLLADRRRARRANYAPRGGREFLARAEPATDMVDAAQLGKKCWTGAGAPSCADAAARAIRAGDTRLAVPIPIGNRSVGKTPQKRPQVTARLLPWLNPAPGGCAGERRWQEQRGSGRGVWQRSHY